MRRLPECRAFAPADYFLGYLLEIGSGDWL
jgi:hypothetical protein